MSFWDNMARGAALGATFGLMTQMFPQSGGYYGAGTNFYGFPPIWMMGGGCFPMGHHHHHCHHHNFWCV